MANLDNEGWGTWTEETRNKGAILNGLLPNSTPVLAIMDDLFRTFKDVLRKVTHDHYAKKIKTNTRQILRHNDEIACKIASGEVVTEKDKAKTRLVVGINTMNLGPILFREMTKDDHANPILQIVTGFIKEKIMVARSKLSFDLYSEVILKNETLWRAIGQWGGDQSNMANAGARKRMQLVEEGYSLAR